MTQYGYDLGGRAVILVAANGQTSQNGYDALGRLTDRTLFKTSAMTEAQVLAQFEWEHDLLGNVLAQHEMWPGEATRSSSIRSTVMGYDANNRLLSEAIQTRSNGSAPAVDQSLTAYTYDDANNRATKTVTRIAASSPEAGENDVGHWIYTYNAANQLTGWEKWDEPSGSLQKTATLTYDAAGNRMSQSIQDQASSIQTTSYAWDAQDRLASVTMPDGSVHEYQYDYRTRRIGTSKSLISDPSSPAQQTAIVFSGGLSVAEWESETGSLPVSPTVEYTRGPDMGGGVGGLLYTSRSDGILPSRTLKYNLSNGRGDIVAQADQSATLTWTASYEAYGKRTKETGTNQDKQRANSKDEDPTGLLNEGFRYRDIETGVWLSRDPAGFVDGPNLYAYVKQNPWTAWDPHGLADEKEQKAVSAPQPTDDNHPLGAGYYTKATATTMSGLEISAKETKNKATAVLFDGSDEGSKDGKLTSGKGFRAYAESITDPSRIFDMSKEGWEKNYLKVSKTIGGYDRAIIADHGWPGGQDAVDETLSGTSHKMKVIADGLKKRGMLVLGGCETMRGPDGKQYAYELQHGVAEDKQLTIVGYTTGVNLPAHSIKVPGGQVAIPFDGAIQIKGVPRPPQNVPVPMPLPPPQPLP